MASIIGSTEINLSADLWVQIDGTMYRVGEMTFDQVATSEEGVREVVDTIAKAAPFIQPLLRQEITVNVEGRP
jgi:hypothetical protein